MSDQIIIRQLPINLKKKDFLIFKESLSFTIKKPIISYLRHCVVLKWGGIISLTGIVDNSLAEPAHKKHYTLRFFIKSLFFYKKYFFYQVKILHIYDQWSENIFHWLHDVLPRLYIFDIQESKFTIILPQNFKKKEYITLSLKHLNLLHRVKWIEEGSFVYARNLILPHHIAPSGNYSPTITVNISKKLKGLSSKLCFGEKIYISRENADKRRITNEQELIPILKNHGYQIVTLEEMAFADQVSIISKSSKIIAPHGAGLSLLSFMEPKSCILEIRGNGSPQNNCYFNLASACSVYYYYIICSSNGISNSFQNDDMKVDIKELETAIQLMDQVGD